MLLIMNTDDFWALVDSASTGHDQPTVDGEAVAAALVKLLAARSPGDILQFEERFEQLSEALYRWDVWAAAYLIGGGCSDDSFMDFRAGVIALGRDWYERVLTSPDALADHPVVRRAAAQGEDYVVFAEPMNYVASHAYEEVTGVDGDGFDEAWHAYERDSAGSDEPQASDMGEDFDFDDDAEMRRRLPMLADLFLAGRED
jgi:hypothetical protein